MISNVFGSAALVSPLPTASVIAAEMVMPLTVAATKTTSPSIKPIVPSGDWHYPLHASQEGLPTDGQTHPDAADDVLLADPELKRPSFYAVVMYNDDYTTMEFVIEMLQKHFKHDLDTAMTIMLAIHHAGKGIAGIYPKDIAETKAQSVNREAQQAGYPLLTQIEPQPNS